MLVDPEDRINAALLIGESRGRILEKLKHENFTAYRQRFFIEAKKKIEDGEEIAPWSFTENLQQYADSLYDSNLRENLTEAINFLLQRRAKEELRVKLKSSIEKLDSGNLRDLNGHIEAILSLENRGGVSMHLAEAGSQAIGAGITKEGADYRLVRTGLPGFDETYGGILSNELIVLGGAGGMGKTSLALAIAKNAAKTIPVLVVNMEMREPDLAARIISSDLSIPGVEFRKMELEPHKEILNQWIESSKELKLWIHYGKQVRPSTLFELAQNFKAKNGLGLLVVDYYQRMTSDTRGLTREQQLSEVSRELKEMNGMLGCPILLIAATNRDIKNREDKRPLISDIRECGQLEFDADSISFVYRDSYYHKDRDPKKAEWIVRKHRGGDANKAIPLKWEKEFTRYSQWDDTWD